MSNQTTALDSYYENVMRLGNLRTPAHAERVTFGVLRSLGFVLSGSTKKKLAKALPEEWAFHLTRGWRLINIRHKNLTVDEFAKDVSLHSGNTDRAVAKVMTRIVFGQIKSQIDHGLIRDVAKDLSPEVRDFWNAA